MNYHLLIDIALIFTGLSFFIVIRTRVNAEKIRMAMDKKFIAEKIISLIISLFS